MDNTCPASADQIVSITKDLEKPMPDSGQLQHLFVNTMGDILPRDQRQACLHDIVAQGHVQQVEHGAELTAKIGVSTSLSAPHRTAHDWQVAAQAITAKDLLPTIQLSADGMSLITHRPDLYQDETSPNGVRQTAYAEVTDPESHKRVLQFGDKVIPLEK